MDNREVIDIIKGELEEAMTELVAVELELDTSPMMYNPRHAREITTRYFDLKEEVAELRRQLRQEIMPHSFHIGYPGDPEA